MQVALITGICAILATMITGLFRIKIGPKRKVKILDLNLIKIDQLTAIEIILHNKSDQNIPVRKIQLITYGGWTLKKTIGRTIYTLSDIAFQLDGKTRLVGSVSKNEGDPKIEREVKGYAEQNTAGSFVLSLSIPLIEELDPNQTKSILLNIPNDILIIGQRHQFLFGPSLRRGFIIDKDSIQRFEFENFIKFTNFLKARVFFNNGKAKFKKIFS